MSTRRQNFRSFMSIHGHASVYPPGTLMPDVPFSTPKRMSESPQPPTLERLALSPYPQSTKYMRIRTDSSHLPKLDPPSNKKSGRLLHRNAQESVYEDPQSHKLFAFVTVPSPRKLKIPSIHSPISLPNESIGDKMSAKSLFLDLQVLPYYKPAKVPIVIQRVYSRCSSRSPVAVSPFSVHGKGICDTNRENGRRKLRRNTVNNESWKKINRVD